MAPCKANGCDRAKFALGYCSRCYQRFKRYGDPAIVHRPGRKPAPTEDFGPRPVYDADGKWFPLLWFCDYERILTPMELSAALWAIRGEAA